MEDIRQEIRTLASLKSEWVTKYHASFVQKSSLCILMEYCDAGSCLDLLKSGNVFNEAGILSFKNIILIIKPSAAY